MALASRCALGIDGTGRKVLNKGPGSWQNEVASWLQGAHDWAGVELLDDLAGRLRVLLARRERGPAIAPAQWGEERA